MSSAVLRRVSTTEPVIVAVQWVLRVAVAATCAGAAVEAFGGNMVGDMLVSTWRLSEEAAMHIEPWAGRLLLIAAGFALFYPCGPVLIPVAGWMACVALARTMSTVPFSELQFLTHAGRMFAPIALTLLARWPRHDHLSLRRLRLTEWTLRIAAGLALTGHGLQAMGHSPEFVRIITETRALFGQPTNPQTLGLLLPLIGGIDLLMGLAVLLGRFRIVAMYMTAWALAAALTRLTAFGFEAYGQTLVRLANVGVPLALLIYWQLGRAVEIQDVVVVGKEDMNHQEHQESTSSNVTAESAESAERNG